MHCSENSKKLTHPLSLFQIKYTLTNKIQNNKYKASTIIIGKHTT